MGDQWLYGYYAPIQKYEISPYAIVESRVGMYNFL